MTRVVGHLVLACASVGACSSTDPDVCTSEIRTISSTECVNALLFAARDSETLLPSTAAVAVYATMWTSVVNAEPILRNRVIQRYRDDLPTLLLHTRNTRVMEAWMRSDILTGDPEFDAVIDELAGVSGLVPARDIGDGVMYRTFKVENIYNEDLLSARLQPTESWLVDAERTYQDDGTWTWTGTPLESTAVLDLQFGWGDCFVGCGGMHFLRAEVTPEGEAVVYDMGGDPVPNTFVGPLSPNTLPPPE